MAAPFGKRRRSDAPWLTLAGVVLLLGCCNEAADAWRTSLYGTSPRPVVSNGIVHVGTADGQIVSLDVGTGVKRWSYQTGVGLPPGDVTITASSLGGALSSLGGGRAEIVLTPVLIGDTLFVASEDRNLYALNAGNGALAWKQRFGELLDLTGSDSLLCVVGPHETLRVLARQDGQERWRFSAWLIHLCSTPERLYVSSSGRADSKTGYVHALDPLSGEELWRATLPGESPLAPVFANGFVYVAITSSLTEEPGRTTLFALDASNGAIRWEFESLGRKTYGFDEHTVSAGVMGEVALLTTDEAVQAIEVASGKALWRHELQKGQDRVLGDSSTVFVTGRSVEAIDLRTGSVRWKVPCSGCAADHHLLDRGTLYVAGKKKIDAVEVTTGKRRWACGVKKEIKTRPAIADGRLFVSTWAGRNRDDEISIGPFQLRAGLGKLPPPGALYAIDLATGKY